jgi:hypothetical protein
LILIAKKICDFRARAVFLGKGKEAGMSRNIAVKAGSLVTGLLGLTLLAGVNSAEAKGCIKGAVVGGVAGHLAGHHGVIGAAAGCAIGHHLANKKQLQQQQAPQSNPSAPPLQPQPTVPTVAL